MVGLLTLVAAADTAFSQLFSPRSSVIVVCRKFDVDNNCHRCSDYFYVHSEDKAIAKCKRMGFEDPYYFPTVGAAFKWMLPNCSCGD